MVQVDPACTPSKQALDVAREEAALVCNAFIDVFDRVEGLCGPASRILLARLQARGVPTLLAFNGEHVWLMLGRYAVDPTVYQFDDTAQLVRPYDGAGNGSGDCGDPELLHYHSYRQWRTEILHDYRDYGRARMQEVSSRLLGPRIAARLKRDAPGCKWKLPELLDMSLALEDPAYLARSRYSPRDVPQLIAA